LKKAERKDFEYFHHKEMINVWGDKYAYPDFNITQHKHIMNYHMVSHQHANFM
jgi:hypothetical protein